MFSVCRCVKGTTTVSAGTATVSALGETFVLKCVASGQKPSAMFVC